MIPSSPPIVVRSRDLYFAINRRDGYFAITQSQNKVAREQTKMIYLPPEEEGLIFKSGDPEESYFLAGYSGEVLSTWRLLNDPILRKDEKIHSYTIALTDEAGDNSDNIQEEEEEEYEERPVRYVSRKWLLSGWYEQGIEDLAIFTNHQIVRTTKEWSFDEIANGAFKNLDIDTTSLTRLTRKLGTQALVFSRPNDCCHDVEDMKEMIVDENELGKYGDYTLEINYPANAQLTRLILDRTFILSPKRENTEEIEVLSAGAEQNRLVHWRGVMCCRVIYIEKLPNAVLEPGDEIIVTYGREYEEHDSSQNLYDTKKNLAYYPENWPYLLPFLVETSTSSGDDKNNNFFIQDLGTVRNAQLVEILCDLVPLVLLLSNKEIESRFAVEIELTRFTSKYLEHYLRGPKYKDSIIFMRRLVLETLVLLLFHSEDFAHLRPIWLKQNAEATIEDDALVIHFVVLIHRLSPYLQADDLDRLTRSLYQSAFIHLVPSSKAREIANQLLHALRIERANRSHNLCFAKEETGEETVVEELPLNLESLHGIAKQVRGYYEIPLLGTTNILYRDALYYMSDADESDESITRLAESLRLYPKLRIYEATRDAFDKLVRPVIFLAQKTLGEEEDARLLMSVEKYPNTIRSLKVMFIFYLEQFVNQARMHDFIALSQIYARLYAMMRLLPLTQLEDEWLERLYRQSRAWYLVAVTAFEENRTTRIDRLAPRTQLVEFDYKTIKQKWQTLYPVSI